MPPPTPVPRMTPKTVSIAAAAPSVASDRAKQLASLAKRTGRPSLVSKSCCNGRPISHVEFAFLTTPVTGEIPPGHAEPDARRFANRHLDLADQGNHCLKRCGVA